MTFEEFCALDDLTPAERREALVRRLCGDEHPITELCEWLTRVDKLRADVESGLTKLRRGPAPANGRTPLMVPIDRVRPCDREVPAMVAVHRDGAGK